MGGLIVAYEGARKLLRPKAKGATASANAGGHRRRFTEKSPPSAQSLATMFLVSGVACTPYPRLGRSLTVVDGIGGHGAERSRLAGVRLARCGNPCRGRREHSFPLFSERLRGGGAGARRGHNGRIRGARARVR